MKKRLFVIPSILAAGLLPLRAEALPQFAGSHPGDQERKSLFDIFKRDHLFHLAGHRSHSSHSSHSSHRSSSGGGYGGYRYVAPAPLYQAPPAPAPVQPQPLVTLPGNSNKFKLIVIQVQNALLLFGYIVPVDGAVGPSTRDALRQFQSDWTLKQTGTITPEVLNALGISAR